MTLSAATDYVAPALEILDTRIVRADPETGSARRIFDTIADNAANAGIVLGPDRHAVDAFDLRWVGAIVAPQWRGRGNRPGRRGAERSGAGRRLAGQPAGRSMVRAIEAGQVVLSGSFIRPIEAPPGARIEADFGAFGAVSVGFEEMS